MTKVRLNLLAILSVLVAVWFGIGFLVPLGNPLFGATCWLFRIAISFWILADLSVLIFSSVWTSVNDSGELCFNPKNPLWRMLRRYFDDFSSRNSLCRVLHFTALLYLRGLGIGVILVMLGFIIYAIFSGILTLDILIKNDVWANLAIRWKEIASLVISLLSLMIFVKPYTKSSSRFNIWGGYLLLYLSISSLFAILSHSLFQADSYFLRMLYGGGMAIGFLVFIMLLIGVVSLMFRLYKYSSQKLENNLLFKKLKDFKHNTCPMLVEEAENE